MEDAMKDKLRVLGALALGLAAMAMPPMSPAQNTSTQNQTAQHHHYKLIQMGTFGGPTSSLDVPGGPPRFPFNRVINSAGAVLGSGDPPIPNPFQLVGPPATHPFPSQAAFPTHLADFPPNPK